MNNLAGTPKNSNFCVRARKYRPQYVQDVPYTGFAGAKTGKAAIGQKVHF